jgi:hypothetical protein
LLVAALLSSGQRRTHQRGDLLHTRVTITYLVSVRKVVMYVHVSKIASRRAAVLVTWEMHECVVLRQQQSQSPCCDVAVRRFKMWLTLVRLMAMLLLLVGFNQKCHCICACSSGWGSEVTWQ